MSKAIDAANIFTSGRVACGRDFATNCPYEEIMSLYQKYKGVGNFNSIACINYSHTHCSFFVSVATPTVLQFPVRASFTIYHVNNTYQYIQYTVNHEKTLISMIQAIDEGNVSITAMFTGTLFQLMDFITSSKQVHPLGLELTQTYLKNRYGGFIESLMTVFGTPLTAAQQVSLRGSDEKGLIQQFFENYYQMTGDVTDTVPRTDFWTQFQILHPNVYTRNKFYDILQSHYQLTVNNNNKFTGVMVKLQRSGDDKTTMNSIRVKHAIKRKREETEVQPFSSANVTLFQNKRVSPLSPTQSRLSFQTQ
jgi:hypothetical protein